MLRLCNAVDPQESLELCHPTTKLRHDSTRDAVEAMNGQEVPDAVRRALKQIYWVVATALTWLAQPKLLWQLAPAKE